MYVAVYPKISGLLHTKKKSRSYQAGCSLQLPPDLPIRALKESEDIQLMPNLWNQWIKKCTLYAQPYADLDTPTFRSVTLDQAPSPMCSHSIAWPE